MAKSEGVAARDRGARHSTFGNETPENVSKAAADARVDLDGIAP
jgi:hypothetical protein